MDIEELKTKLKVGETVAVEFKRAGSGIHADAYESICALLNRFGGDVYFGVLDDGTVEGVPSRAAPEMVRSLINNLGNPNLFVPAVHLEPKIVKVGGKTIIHLHVPQTPDIYRFKGTIYDRLNDSDVKVVAAAEIAAMGIRKQGIYTERKVYPYVKASDLRLDLLPRIRIRAANFSGGKHPWTSMTDEELLKSARLYGVDKVTGEKGFNLAAIMLLGSDDLILDVCPAYMIDALFRRTDPDRYDDRDIVQTNLVESVGRLMDFGSKHLPDPFFLNEKAERISIRDIIIREMVVNMLIHREFTSSKHSRFVIEPKRIYTENPCRATKQGLITPENLEPDPKNPIVAAFFRTIGFADELGSGVRKMFKYGKSFGGTDPMLTEGDIFRDELELTSELFNSAVNGSIDDEKSNVPVIVPVIVPVNVPVKSTMQDRVFDAVVSTPGINRVALAKMLGVDVRTVGRLVSALKGRIEFRGAPKTGGYWEVVGK